MNPDQDPAHRDPEVEADIARHMARQIAELQQLQDEMHALTRDRDREYAAATTLKQRAQATVRHSRRLSRVVGRLCGR